MTEQPLFDPATLGFVPEQPRVSRIGRPTGCYVKLTNSSNRDRCALMLDTETASKVAERFGGRVSVTPDENGALMVYSGDDYKVGAPSKRGNVRITIDRRASEMLQRLGDYGNHPYAVAYSNGQMLILAPQMVSVGVPRGALFSKGGIDGIHSRDQGGEAGLVQDRNHAGGLA